MREPNDFWLYRAPPPRPAFDGSVRKPWGYFALLFLMQSCVWWALGLALIAGGRS